MAEERSAAKTMDEVRDGMQAVMVIAMDRLREAEEALQAGDFARASSRITEASAKVSALTSAETQLAAFAGKTVVRGREIAEGTEIVGAGRVLSVENVSDHSDDCDEAIFQYALDDGEVRRAYSDQEILVARSGQ
jgi:uncharacterized protein with PhoU and TrkA domain